MGLTAPKRDSPERTIKTFDLNLRKTFGDLILKKKKKNRKSGKLEQRLCGNIKPEPCTHNLKIECFTGSQQVEMHESQMVPAGKSETKAKS